MTSSEGSVPDGTSISVWDPAGAPDDMPIWEGAADCAHYVLTPGVYRGTLTAAPAVEVLLVVSEVVSGAVFTGEEWRAWYADGAAAVAEHQNALHHRTPEPQRCPLCWSEQHGTERNAGADVDRAADR